MDGKIRSLSDIMVPMDEYPSVCESDSVNQAIVVLRQYLAKHKGHRSLLVQRESDDRVIGILNVTDIMQSVKEMTRSYDFDEVSRIAHSFDGYGRKARLYREKLLREGFDKTVEEIMCGKPVVTIDVEETGSAAAKLMLTKNVQVLPVLSGDRVVGVVRFIDVLDYIAGFLAH